MLCRAKTSAGNDHRFGANWSGGLGISSFSRVFDYKSRDSWTAKLKVVHAHAWQTWQEKLSMKPGYGLPPEQIQEGGVIPDDVMAEIADQVESLPAKVKYGYGSIPINTIFSGMNIHRSQLFWCELQGYKVLTHCHIAGKIDFSMWWKNRESSEGTAVAPMAWWDLAPMFLHHLCSLLIIPLFIPLFDTNFQY